MAWENESVVTYEGGVSFTPNDIDVALAFLGGFKESALDQLTPRYLPSDRAKLMAVYYKARAAMQ